MSARPWQPLSREEVMRRIEALTSQFLEVLESGNIVDMEALNRNTAAMTFSHEHQRVVHNNDKRMIKMNRNGARKYTAIWLILQTAYALLSEQKTVTQREIYYLHPFFNGQQEADEAVLDAGSILGVPRGSMNIVGATKGCFTGYLRILNEGQWISFNNGEESSITQRLLQLSPQEITSDAQCIIVVEKDGIFNRLREDKFGDRVPSILITGRGFPDLSTRAFVSLLSGALGIPVFGLCDCNPFGLSIMVTSCCSLIHGVLLFVDVNVRRKIMLDLKRHILTSSSAVDIKWIGLRPTEIADIGLPSSVFKPLTRKDVSTANSLLRSPFVQSHPEYLQEVKMWVEDELPWKIELEAMHFLGFGFLASYLERCIVERNFL